MKPLIEKLLKGTFQLYSPFSLRDQGQSSANLGHRQSGQVKKAKLVLLLSIVVLLAVFVLQNREPWQVRFLWLSGEMPAIVVLFLTAAAGLVAGIISALLVRRGTKIKSE